MHLPWTHFLLIPTITNQTVVVILSKRIRYRWLGMKLRCSPILRCLSQPQHEHQTKKRDTSHSTNASNTLLSSWPHLKVHSRSTCTLLRVRKRNSQDKSMSQSIKFTSGPSVLYMIIDNCVNTIDWYTGFKMNAQRHARNIMVTHMQHSPP